MKRQLVQESRNLHNLMYSIKLHKFRSDCQFGIREKKSEKIQANHHKMIFDNALNQQAFLVTENWTTTMKNPCLRCGLKIFRPCNHAVSPRGTETMLFLRGAQTATGFLKSVDCKDFSSIFLPKLAKPRKFCLGAAHNQTVTWSVERVGPNGFP